MRMRVKRYYVVCDMIDCGGHTIIGAYLTKGLSRYQMRKAMRRLLPRFPGAYCMIGTAFH